MNKFLSILAVSFFLLGMSGVSNAALFGCTVTGSTCVSSGCKTVTSSDGSPACVCTAGTQNAPAGCLIDSAASCWQESRTYQCYTDQTSNSCTPQQVGGCLLLNSSCTAQATNGTCVSYEQTWACPDQATLTCNPSIMPGANCAANNIQCQVNLYGYCVDQTMMYVCTKPTTPCNTDPSCTQTGSTCISSMNGVCSTEQQNFTCSKTTMTCTQSGYQNNCTGVVTDGYENQVGQKQNPDAMNKALQALAILDEIKKSISDSMPPKIFSGAELECTNELFCGSFLSACCCGLDVKATDKGLLNNCSADEAKLAGERRKSLTHYLDSGCAHPVSFLGHCLFCSVSAQWYCGFPSLLAKIVQEQGREQLAALASKGYAGATQKSLSFNFYAPQGQWVGPANVNGNDVWYYQWPQACNSNTVAAPATDTCPTSLDSWFAVCDGADCAAPTAAPPGVTPQGMMVNKATYGESGPFTLSRYAVADGQCDQSGNCNFTISAWPGSGGGTAMLRMPVSWSYYSSQAGWNNPVSLGNSYVFQGYSVGFDQRGQPVNGVQFQYSTDQGATFSTITLPLELPASQNYVIPGTQISVFGSCPGPYYGCKYYVTAPAKAEAKPWILGESSNSCGVSSVDADCSGFTIGQFMLLDLNKMDLSQWLATIKPTPPDQATLQANATNQSTAMKAANTASLPQTDNSEAVVVRLSAASCQQAGSTDECNITLTATSSWDQTYTDSSLNNNPVSGIDIDWGDGTTNSVSTTQVVNGLPLFTIAHHFQGVGIYPVSVTFKMPDGSTHHAGVQEQVWDNDPPASNAQNSAAGGSDIVPPGAP